MSLLKLEKNYLTKHHSHIRRNVFLSNGLSQSFENGCLKKERKAQFIDELPKVGSPTFSSKFNQGWLTNLLF